MLQISSRDGASFPGSRVVAAEELGDEVAVVGTGAGAFAVPLVDDHHVGDLAALEGLSVGSSKMVL